MKQKLWFWLTRRKMIWLSLLVIMVLFLCFPSPTEAAGWVKESLGGKDALYNFEKYPLDNYNLDFYVDTSWNWLPWKWGEGISETVIYAVFAITNIFWMLNVYLCYFLGFVVQEAFELDFISDMVDSLAKTIQTIAGIDKGGMLSTGLVPIFGGLLIALAGCSVVYQAVVKQHPTQAIQQALVFLFTFICCGVFFMNARSYLDKVNTVQQEINTEMLDIAKNVSLGDSKGGSSTKAIRENLFSLQIEEPWKILQFGDNDTEKVGEDRIGALLKESPYSEDEKRNELIEKEVEDKNNGNLSVQKVYLRFGMVFLVLVANIVISLSVAILTIVLIASQVLFLLYAGFLPVAMIFSLFPGSSRILGTALQKVFQLLFTKMGITLILTIIFSISHELNALTKEKGYIWSSFLQISLWFSAATRVNELLGFMRIGGTETRAADRTGRFLRGMFLGSLSRGFTRRIAGGMAGGLGGAAIASTALLGTKRIKRPGTSSTIPLMERVGKKVSAISEMPKNVTGKWDQVKRSLQYVPTNAKYKGREMRQDYLAGRIQEQNRQGQRRQLAQQRQQNLYEAREGVLSDDQKEKQRQTVRQMAQNARQDRVLNDALKKKATAMHSMKQPLRRNGLKQGTINEQKEARKPQVIRASAICSTERKQSDKPLVSHLGGKEKRIVSETPRSSELYEEKPMKQSATVSRPKTFVFDRQLMKGKDRLNDAKNSSERKEKRFRKR
ncbi:CD3337/EF1877 family mobilome membrane protein [Enterococcus gallinarum]|uniref:Amino acid transporter n=1 Tax=Enterococcus gallinarum TaxID=1353 RepID=A0A376GZ10_ENTGA|nr:hypothetical protein [Enterococcus gallinarum]OJG48018.1 hypothetical protein RV03_GL001465 [Enterococcus gallinarum]STD72751.1 amino acid transporter [Enterococcus gallinarum]STD82620.1 amino acid transporter [Enterococcus gallinarum]